MEATYKFREASTGYCRTMNVEIGRALPTNSYALQLAIDTYIDKYHPYDGDVIAIGLAKQCGGTGYVVEYKVKGGRQRPQPEAQKPTRREPRKTVTIKDEHGYRPPRNSR